MTTPGETRFPTIREDGTFAVRACFRSTNDGVFDLVRGYVDAWTRANRSWVRIWRSNTIEEERLDFSADFLSDPRVERDGPHRFAVVLEGKALSRRWKDWAVRLVDEIEKVFPECRFDRFE